MLNVHTIATQVNVNRLTYCSLKFIVYVKTKREKEISIDSQQR